MAVALRIVVQPRGREAGGGQNLAIVGAGNVRRVPRCEAVLVGVGGEEHAREGVPPAAGVPRPPVALMNAAGRPLGLRVRHRCALCGFRSGRGVKIDGGVQEGWLERCLCAAEQRRGTVAGEGSFRAGVGNGGYVACVHFTVNC